MKAKPFKPNWLQRGLILSPYLLLCLDQKEFNAIKGYLNVTDETGPWVKDGASGCVHTLEASENSTACVVCVRPEKGTCKSDLYALLAHEAVHVYHEVADMYPGVKWDEETAATGIQLITGRLIAEYMRRKGLRN